MSQASKPPQIQEIEDDDDANNNNLGYAWEEEYKRSWDVVQEDEQGSLRSVVANLQQQKRRRLLRDTSTIRRGIIRHLYLILDMSADMMEKDYRPHRLGLTVNYVEAFILEYFDQNPISQIGLIITRDGIAEKLTELSGNPMDHIRAIRNKNNQDCVGEPSLQNALEMARNALSHVPSHGSREILVIFGSLTTCDPGNIHETIQLLKNEEIRCSMVQLSAEVQVFKTLCKETGGKFSVAMNDMHYRDIMFETIPPPPTTTANSSSNLVKMGFPTRIVESIPSFCVCHQKPVLGGFVCPRCKSKICELPTDCDVCNLTLVSSPHLARSYHHLFPVENFVDVDIAQCTSTCCFACQMTFENKRDDTTEENLLSDITPRFQCPKCKEHFCIECDLFSHDILHNCPGCSQK
ncbi:hypothetical protein K7432_001986 [Basidiobolus ranarum]|uniref:General transcription and DNA repair factor IIH n=1 Tax=Basidiobolus ranarum TaxID=34480 RepID=A0ABR2W8R7_9FUNG